MLETLLAYFARYGYFVVFFGVMLENAGVPIPGETILLAAGFFAAQGHFHLWEVMAIAALGAMIGDNVGFAVGHSIGRSSLQRYGRYILLTHKRLAHIDKFFARYGDKTILFARFVTGLRVFAALFAGAARMRWRTFLFYNSLGAILWSVVISLLGFFFGHSWNLLEHWISRTGIVILAALLAIVVTLVWRRQARHSE